jgi:hypothetical protein
MFRGWLISSCLCAQRRLAALLLGLVCCLLSYTAGLMGHLLLWGLVPLIRRCCIDCHGRHRVSVSGVLLLLSGEFSYARWRRCHPTVLAVQYAIYHSYTAFTVRREGCIVHGKMAW